jgi:hypothetical protein
MPRLAKILLVGTVLAFPMLAPLSAAATDPSTVSQNGAGDNTPSPQVNLGDVFATQTLNVDTVTGSTNAVTTATGNSLLTGADAGVLDVHSVQTNATVDGAAGQINATTFLNVTNGAGTATMITAATGNTAEADASDGAVLTSAFNQTANGAPIYAENDVYGPTANADSLTASAQAIANSVSLGTTASLSTSTIDQYNTASVDARNDHDVTGTAILDFTAGTVSYTSIALANNVTATGVDGSSEYLVSAQTNNGAHVLAGVIAYVNDAQTLQADATVSSNNFSASNESGDLNVTSSQTNNSFSTAAEVALGAFEFGTADALASGVGNSLLAANYGPTTELSNTQVNNGEVSATATFNGGNSSSTSPSYDASASSSAIGNGATAFACSNCGGVIDIASSQTNTNTISASSLIDITGDNRNVSATATAVGNSASFYVSKPK